ncbi:hypothetical protein BY458DRAFT_510069 [Sporodiniella umbellata]|nr:hypothetical protein BY458DRAFT_510069 [Sporodiniella umbellata]
MFQQAIVNSFSGHGPFCLNFTVEEQPTILALKKRLEQVTFVSARDQKIKTMGGRMLQDHDVLFQPNVKDPSIFNLSVSMVGGLQMSREQDTRR